MTSDENPVRRPVDSLTAPAPARSWPSGWVDRMAEIDDCDGYIVLVADPETGETDTHGPFDGPDAAVDADRRRRSFDDDGLTDVRVRVVRFHAAGAAAAA